MRGDAPARFGRSGLDVTALTLGTAPIGNFNREMGEDVAAAIIARAWDRGVRTFDTSPLYGHGLAEYRLGHALRWKDRNDYVVSTKVGRTLHPAPRAGIDSGRWVRPAAFEARFDYSYDGAMRSFEDSLQRMGLERIDILYIHDLDRYNHGDALPEVFEAALAGAWRAIERLRDEGLVRAIGFGLNEWQACQMAIERCDVDCFLLAGRYTLLDQKAADTFLPLCAERDVAVMLGGGFNSGILATGAKPGAQYDYGEAPAPILERVRRMEEICRARGVDLPAAALQFVLAHPAVPTFCAGVRTVAQLDQNLAWLEQAIPSVFWSDLKAQNLLAPDARSP